jgi:hypothetical protein
MASLIVSESSSGIASGSGEEPAREVREEKKFIPKDLIFVGKGNPQPSKYIIVCFLSDAVMMCIYMR